MFRRVIRPVKNNYSILRLAQNRFFSLNTITRNQNDVFAQAIKDQKARDDEAKAGQKGPKKSEASEEPVIDGDQKLSSSKEKKHIGLAIGLGVLASYLYLGWGTNKEDESAFDGHNRRSIESIKDSYDYFMDPPQKKLLPKLPKAYAREYTICIELTDALTHLIWDKDLGWRVALRPGLKEFLYMLNKFAEVVIFTDTTGYLAEPVIQTFDQVGLTHYRLYREHHRLEKDTHLKDLEFLNRDLAKVIVIETDMDRLKTHPENGLKLKSWFGEADDTELFKFGKLLHVIAIQQKQPDLRALLSEINSFGVDDAPQSWESYKQKLKGLEVKDEPLVAPSQTFVSQILASTGSVVQSLLGAGPMKKQYSYGTSISQLEEACTLIRVGIVKDYDRFLQAEKKMMDEQRKMIERHQNDLKNSDLKLIDYLMGNVPQPGEGVQS